MPICARRRAGATVPRTAQPGELARNFLGSCMAFAGSGCFSSPKQAALVAEDPSDVLECRVQQPLVLDMAAGALSAAERPGLEPRSRRRGVCKPRFCTRNGSRASALTSSSRGYCTQQQLCLCTQWQQRLLMRLETVLQQQNSEAVAAFTAFSEIEFLRAGTGAAASAPEAAAAASALICSSRLCAQKQQLLQRS